MEGNQSVGEMELILPVCSTSVKSFFQRDVSFNEGLCEIKDELLSFSCRWSLRYTGGQCLCSELYKLF